MPSEGLDAEVIVVGAGVAGAATAIALGRRGRRVLLLDRANFPRDKPCGEGIMPNGVAALRELGLLSAVEKLGARRIDAVRYSMPAGESAEGRFGRSGAAHGYALGVRRLALDGLLLERAAATPGVVVRTGCRVRDLRFGPERVTALVGDAAFHARAVVGADGIHSRLRAIMGWQRPRRWYRFGAVGHFGGSGCVAPPRIEILLTAGMEAYVTPLAGDEVLVALLGGRELMAGLAGKLTTGYEQIVRRLPGLPSAVSAGQLRGPVLATGPFAVRSKRVAGMGIMLVGDAAGFLDPITGSGIGSALEQALAAAAVLDLALARGAGLPNLRAFGRRRAKLMRTPNAVTMLGLGICVAPALRRRAVGALGLRPQLFDKLLAINSRQAGLGRVTPREWAALLTGW